MEQSSNRADVIGGFSDVDANCKGCGKPLTLENAWMTDGCPCNTPIGVNNANETRWRLLMSLQQRQSHENERLRGLLLKVWAEVHTNRGGGEYDTSVVDAVYTILAKEPLDAELAATAKEKANDGRNKAG